MKDKEQPMTELQAEARAADLAERFTLIERRNVSRQGDVVVWKRGMKHSRAPAYGEPAIVTRVYTAPIIDEEYGQGSPYFRERLDIVVAVIDEDGRFLEFHMDSRRFEHFQGLPA